MRQERFVEEEGSQRTVGQRPDRRERAELQARVERALMGGATRPADVLDAVPELGTWDTAKSYVEEVRTAWRDEASREERREQRAEMVATVRAARKRAFVAMGRAEKVSEVERLGRLIDRLIQRECWLLDLDPEGMADEDRRNEWDLKEAVEKAAEEAAEEDAARARRQRRESRDAERARLAQRPDDPENPNPARMGGEGELPSLPPLDGEGPGPGFEVPENPNPARIEPTNLTEAVS